MPEWNTDERGTMRDDEESGRSTGYDGLSDMDVVGVPALGLDSGRPVEEFGFGGVSE